MQVEVNGTRLWFDVDGPAFVPNGSRLVERPTLVLVHGGPGSYDHSYFKPHFAQLTDHAQLVYLDIRGHGRSARQDEPLTWSFEVCADDVRAFCDALGIARPIVFGHSMGGFIAMLYAARHPDHPAAVILQSTMARFDPRRLVEGFRSAAGDEVARLAGLRSAETCSAGSTLSTNSLGSPAPRWCAWGRSIRSRRWPPHEIVSALPAQIGQLEVLDAAGHFAWLDRPDRYWPLVTSFVATAAAAAGYSK